MMNYLEISIARDRIATAALDWYTKKITSDELKKAIGEEADLAWQRVVAKEQEGQMKND